MIKMQSDPALLQGSATQVFTRLSNPERLAEIFTSLRERAQQAGATVPEEVQKNLDKITVNADSITVGGSPMGDLVLRIGQCTPNTLVTYVGANTPIPLSIKFLLTPGDDQQCTCVVEMEADIPVFVRPMVAGPLKKGLEMFSTLLAKVPDWN